VKGEAQVGGGVGAEGQQFAHRGNLDAQSRS
jgi:hypothetical protein